MGFGIRDILLQNELVLLNKMYKYLFKTDNRRWFHKREKITI